MMLIMELVLIPRSPRQTEFIPELIPDWFHLQISDLIPDLIIKPIPESPLELTPELITE